MDPKELMTADWQHVSTAVNLFWFFAASLVIAALSFALSQAIIPSLITTSHLTPRLRVARPFLYAVSLVAFVLAAALLYSAVYATYSVIREVYPRWWV